MDCQLKDSPKNIADNNKTRTTLDLSIGETRDALPSCKALK